MYSYRPQGSCGQGNIFTPVCHSVHRGGVCLSACWDTPCQGDTPPAKETPPCQGDPPPPPGPHPRGKLRGIRSRPTPKAETEGGSDPGPHPRGKLKGIRSRPTPKGEIEGDQIQAPLPPRNRLRHTVNERPVRILLECILVWIYIHIRKSCTVSNYVQFKNAIYKTMVKICEKIRCQIS